MATSHGVVGNLPVANDESGGSGTLSGMEVDTSSACQPPINVPTGRLVGNKTPHRRSSLPAEAPPPPSARVLTPSRRLAPLGAVNLSPATGVGTPPLDSLVSVPSPRVQPQRPLQRSNARPGVVQPSSRLIHGSVASTLSSNAPSVASDVAPRPRRWSVSTCSPPDHASTRTTPPGGRSGNQKRSNGSARVVPEGVSPSKRQRPASAPKSPAKALKVLGVTHSQIFQQKAWRRLGIKSKRELVVKPAAMIVVKTKSKRHSVLSQPNPAFAPQTTLSPVCRDLHSDGASNVEVQRHGKWCGSGASAGSSNHSLPPRALWASSASTATYASGQSAASFASAEPRRRPPVLDMVKESRRTSSDDSPSSPPTTAASQPNVFIRFLRMFTCNSGGAAVATLPPHRPT